MYGNLVVCGDMKTTILTTITNCNIDLSEKCIVISALGEVNPMAAMMVGGDSYYFNS